MATCAGFVRWIPLAVLVAGCSSTADDVSGAEAAESALEGVYRDREACRRPVVDDCAFYRECLEAKTPCGAEGYALGFGERMCNVYLDQASQFSPAGREWLRGVRLCLQVELVRELDGDASCSELERRAYASHGDCYTRPEHSICDLDIKDRTTLVHVTGRELFSRESLGQMQGIIATCLK